MNVFKGKKKGYVHTMNITLDDIRVVFFPRNFYEKYSYLGSVPYDDKKTMLHALVMAMDAEAKPWWCPRWFLRFLHLFGSDNSIVRVRNFFLHNLSKKLTKGIMMVDYKTKWEDYDLRISVHAPEYLQDLADAIETITYNRGYKNELIEQIKEIDPTFDKTWWTKDDLRKHLDKITIPEHQKRFDEILDEVYKAYTDKYVGHEDVPIKEVFWHEVKTNKEFAKDWGLTVSEDELSLEERFELFKNTPKSLKKSIDVLRTRDLNSTDFFEPYGTPKKCITVTYKYETIEIYE